MINAIANIPKLNYKPDPEDTKALTITCTLRQMGYAVKTKRDAVKLIEDIGTQHFNFDYPYGSFEAFKEHTLAGEYDLKNTSQMTEFETAYYNNLLQTGIHQITY